MIIKRGLSTLLFLFVLTLPIGSESASDTTLPESVVTTEGVEVDGRGASYIEVAKKIVKDYNLTQVQFECLEFENIGEVEGFKAVVDVRELHNENCPGDIQTSPRLFSVAFDKNNKIWSDTKSLVGQLEPLE